MDQPEDERVKKRLDQDRMWAGVRLGDNSPKVIFLLIHKNQR